ncbi:MAG TPA: tetratricopeptide repeat protein [Thermoanaerobaculia bacterium]|nr:tetratricopeptide repeat protein [Thermoanaerobaculia bacterium]
MAGTKREALLASAEKSLQKGKVDSALKDYLKILEETPGDINILNKVGDLYTRLNRNEEAIPYLTRIAEHFARDGFFLRGIAIYKRINRLDPARLDVYERLAELYAKQGLTTDAKSQYQVLADYHARNDNAIGAIGIYQKMVAIDPQNIQLHVKLADFFTQARRKPDALKEYTIVATLLRERGAVDEAIQVYEKALQMAPDNVEVLRSFVPLLVGASRAREARLFVKRALETTPRSVPLFLLAAEAALQDGDVKDAQEWLAKAQAIEASSDEVLQLAVRVQQAGGVATLTFEAAAALADQAMRRGEAKKALGILTPLAESSLGREDVLVRVVQVAEAAGDHAAVVRWRSALVDLHKGQNRIGDAAEGLRTLLKLVPDSAEFRTRLSQLDPSLGRGVERSGSRERPVIAPPPSIETSASRRRPAPEVPSAPPPLFEESTPPVASKPAAPPLELAVPPAASLEVSPSVAAEPPGEFVFDLEDGDLVHDPGSTGPVPAAVRRLSQPGTPAFDRSASGKRRPSAPALGALDQLPEVPPLSTAPNFGTAARDEAGFDWGASQPLPEISRTHVPPAEEAEPAVEVEPAIEVESALEVEPAVEVESPEEAPAAPVPPVEPAGEPLPAAVEEQAIVLSSDAVEGALGEAEVFRKYGLYDKAIEHLRSVLKRAPHTLALREKVFELALEGGRRKIALAEAEKLKDRYRSDGREDRVAAIDALLVERTSAEMGEPAEAERSSPGTKPRTRGVRPESPQEPAPSPVPSAAAEEPSAEELLEIDFCLEQGMVVDASERLQALERKFPGHPQIARRRARLDGGPGEDARPALSDILSEDFESVLDAELGRALTDQMAKGAEEPAPPETPEPPAGSGVLADESSLFSDEQEFFNFAGELQSEMRQESAPPEASVDASGREIPLEEIFREFKKGVEQQLSPEDYETHYNLGIAYKEMSLTDEAISEFQRASKSPQYAVECCSMLGLCFLEKGMPQLAIKWYKKGLEAPNIRDDDRLGLQYDLASVYAGLGDRDNAYKTFLEIYGANASFRDVGERLRELSPA